MSSKSGEEASDEALLKLRQEEKGSSSGGASAQSERAERLRAIARLMRREARRLQFMIELLEAHARQLDRAASRIEGGGKRPSE